MCREHTTTHSHKHACPLPPPPALLEGAPFFFLSSVCVCADDHRRRGELNVFAFSLCSLKWVGDGTLLGVLPHGAPPTSFPPRCPPPPDVAQAVLETCRGR